MKLSSSPSFESTERIVQIDGVTRLVAMPQDQVIPVDEAIPIDAHHIIMNVFADASEEFRTVLWQQLWLRELRKPEDFLKPNAMKMINQALKVATRKDALSILQAIQEE